MNSTGGGMKIKHKYTLLKTKDFPFRYERTCDRCDAVEGDIAVSPVCYRSPWWRVFSDWVMRSVTERRI
jgi:hypothetical protein